MEFSNWQTELSTVRERTEYAYKNNLYCDVKFSVVDSNGGKVTVPANKYMLAVSSPVFAAMLYGDLTEKQEIIDLPDCTMEGLQEMLHFVHSDEVNLTGSNVIEILYIAEKYIMPFLVKKCREYIQRSLKPEEVFIILPQVQNINGDQFEGLEDNCWSLVDNEAQRALSSEPFLDVSREMLCQILTRDSLIINELDVFQAVDRWVSKRIEEEGLENSGTTKRAILGEEVIRLIRFPLMSQSEVAEVVVPCEILEKQELPELFQLFSNVSPSTSIFNKERRGKKEYSKSRFTIIRPPSYLLWEYDDDQEDAIGFTVNKAASLAGVRLFGSQGSTYNVQLEIYKDDRVISKVSSSFDSEMIIDQYYGFTVALDEPLKLDPHALYTVKALIRGPQSYHGYSGQIVVNVDASLKVTYKTSDMSSSDNNCTNVNKGQFPSLLLLH